MKESTPLLIAAIFIAPVALAQSRDCRGSDPDKAIEACSADIKRDSAIPANAGMLPALYNLRALAYEKKDRLDEARADLDTIIKLKPDFDAYFNRAVFCSEHGPVGCALADFEAAIAAYEKRVPPEKAWEGSYADANFRRAELLRLNDRIAEAMPNYDKAIATRPDNPEFRFNRALANSRLERIDAVIADLTRVIGPNPRRGPFTVSALNNRGVAYMRKGEYAQAIADLDTALALDPGSPMTLVRRGLVHEKAGQRDKAIADYRESLKIYARLQDAQEGLQRLGAAP
jgi:tetratricopeptide (TPR) repeat protein